jgi:hypothetical protein
MIRCAPARNPVKHPDHLAVFVSAVAHRQQNAMASIELKGTTGSRRDDRANSSNFAAASDGEDLDEHHTGDETTNVCCIGNAACLHTAEDAEAFD